MAVSPPGSSTAPEAEVPWGVADGATSVLLAFTVYIFGSVLVGLAASVLHLHMGLGVGAASYQFLALGTAISVAILIVGKHHIAMNRVGFRFPGVRTLVFAAAAVFPILLAIALIAWLFQMFLPGYHLQGNARELLQGTSPNIGPLAGIGVILFSAVEAPIVEETLFRGVLFQGLRAYYSERMSHHLAVFVAAAISGLVFGIAHFEVHTLPILVVLGIALAYVFQYSRSVYASALVHAIINFNATVNTFHIHV